MENKTIRYILIIIIIAAISYLWFTISSITRPPAEPPDVAEAPTPTPITFTSWGVQHMGADVFAQNLRDNGKNEEIIIAVVDTGVDESSPVFEGRLVPGYNTVDSSQNTSDSHGHGTAMAAIIADTTRALPNVKIMPIKLAETDRRFPPANIDRGIRYAIDNGARVINMSFGLTNARDDAPETNRVIANLVANNPDVLFVAAASNSRRNSMYYIPARIPGVVTVSAIAENGNFAVHFSNFGSNIDVAAPGSGIMIEGPNGRPIPVIYGTSNSAAFVSAVAAMHMLNNPGITAAETRNLIREYVDDMSGVGWNRYYGAGVPFLRNVPINNPLPPLQPGGSSNVANYLDVQNHWAEAIITTMIENEIVNGYERPTGHFVFLPNESITRAEFVTLLASISGENLNRTNANFADVSPDDWFAPHVTWGSRRNIVAGDDFGNFRPQELITRQEMAVMLSRLAARQRLDRGIRRLDFATLPTLNDDAQINEWALESVMRMRALNIIKGDDYGDGRPLENATRAEAVTMIYNLQNLQN